MHAYLFDHWTREANTTKGFIPLELFRTETGNDVSHLLLTGGHPCPDDLVSVAAILLGVVHLGVLGRIVGVLFQLGVARGRHRPRHQQRLAVVVVRGG